MPHQGRAAIVRFVDRAYERLEDVDYYSILAVDATAGEVEIRAAYYRLAARLHPDVFGDAAPPAFRRKLTAVFSRVVEAYRVLVTPDKRDAYDRGLAEGRVRWDESAARAPQPAPELAVKNEGARRFFILGRDALRARDFKAAVMNLRLALSMDPDSEVIKEALAAAEAGQGGGHG